MKVLEGSLINALLNIMVRVTSGAARAELAKMRAEIAAAEAQMKRSGAATDSFSGSMSRGISPISKWGNQVQWAGRQLQYNFTLPLLLAGGAAAKFELDNEKAMTRVAKVYGDNTPIFNQLAEKEIPALGRAFEALSNKFGVTQAQVINIGADWAAAGASGLALAKAVDLTMKTIVLGEMDAKDATQSLIAIQSQYGASTEELAKIIDTLNMVENQTGVSMEGLIQGMARSAGVARTAGVDYTHLAAMIAALSPAAGTAAQAGTALKTIFSRLMVPTTQTAEVLGLMGINVDDVGWQSLNATQRLEKMAQTMQGLSSAQKVVVDATVASNWQINKFDVLMKALVNDSSYYAKALNTASNAAANHAQAIKELNMVLDSNPQKLKQIWVILQNSMADIIQPMIPAILMLANALAGLFRSFENMNPAVQKFVLYALLALAAVGPLARYVGATVTLFKIMGDIVGWTATAFRILGSSIITTVTGPLSLLANMLGSMSGLVARAIGGMTVGFVAGGKAMIGTFARVMFVGLTVVGSGIWTILTSIVSIFAAVIPRLASISTIMTAGLVRIWGAVNLAIEAIWISLSRALVMIQAMTGKAMLAVTSRFGALLVAAWEAISAAVVAVITSPWTAVVIIIIGVIYALRNRLARAWNVIVNETVQAFNALPQGIYNALKAVVDMVRAAALAVYHWFSYINPFAHHSPSLVEVVTWGVAEIKKQYGSLANVGTVFKKAASDLAAFKKAGASLGQSKFGDAFDNISQNLPSLIGLFHQLEGDYNVLNDLLDAQQSKVNAQQRVVDIWKAKLDAADAVLDQQKNLLSQLQDNLGALSDAYDKHKQAAQNFADAPIQGMKAMSDAMFENEMAQKKLQLQILQWEQTHGSIDSITNSMSKLQGSIEKLKADMTDLQKGGAGSDITGPMQQQLDAMQSSFDQMQQTVQNSPIDEMQKQLADLQKQGDILNLQNSITFDPLKKQIEELNNTQKELSYDDIVAGIQKEKAAMAALQPQIDAATKAVDAQTSAVAKAQAARDQIAAVYDAESKKLDTLKSQYDEIEKAVRAVESAINDMNSAATKAGQAKSNSLTPAGKAFAAGAGGDFPDVGGMAQIGREGGLKDQSKQIDDFAKQISQDAANALKGIDMFGPIKDMWNSTWGWIKKNIMPTINGIGKAFSDAASAFGNPFDGLKVSKTVTDSLHGLWGVVKTVVDGIVKVFKLFWPDIKRVWDILWKAGSEAFNKIGGELAKFAPLLGPLIQAFKNIWNIIQPIVLLLGGALLFAIKLVAGIIVNTLGPVLNGIISIIAGVIQVVRGFIEVFIAIFTGDWSMLWKGVVDLFVGTWNTIIGFFSGVIGTVIGVVRGLIDGIIGFFQWLFDVLVGHSIVPDLIKAIVKWFASLPGWVMGAIIGLGAKLFSWAWNALTGAWNALKSVWSSITKWLGGIIGGFIGAVGDIGKALWDWATKAFNRVWDGFKNIWTSVTGWLGGLIKSALGAIGDLGKALFDFGKAALQRELDGFKKIWETIKSWFGGLPQGMIDAMGDIGSIFMNAGKKIVQMLADGISAVADLPGKALKGIVHGLGKLIPGSPVQEGPLMSLNNGHSGKMIASMLAGGISAGEKDAIRAATSLASNVNDALSVGGGTFTANAIQGRASGYVGGMAGAIANKLAVAGAFGSSQVSSSGGGSTELHFHGDLSFPNITSGTDAEEFIRNLQNLAGN